LNGFPFEYAVIGVGILALVLLYRFWTREPVTHEQILGKYEIILPYVGDKILGLMTKADRIWRDVAFINRMAADQGLTEEQLNALRRIYVYAVRDEATRSPRDKTLLFSTDPLGPESAYVKPIRWEQVLPGRFENVYFAEGYGERIGTIGDYNVAYIIPRNMQSLQDEPLKNFPVNDIKNLGEMASYSRRAAINISEIQATKQQVEDRTATVDKLVKENLSLRDQVNMLKTMITKKPLRELPELAVEAAGRGNLLWYIIAAVVGYFAGTNISQTFMEPQQLGFIGFIAAPAALYYFYFRRKAAPRV